MDFNFTPEQELFRRTVREFAESVIAPRSREIDQMAAGIPEDIIRGMAELGLFGVTIPEAYGGTASPGEEMVYAMITVHEIARAELSMSLPVYTLLNLGWSYLVVRHGTERLKQELLPRIANGDWFLGICTTEASGGSDVAAIQTTATKRNGTYVLNGEKIYISGVTEAQKRGGGHLTLFRTNPELGIRGMTFAYVPINANGISTTLFEDMGRMGLSTGGITYRDTEIPDYYVLGEENRGFHMNMEGFNVARVLVCAACTGGAERALEMSAEYTSQRRLFGRPLANFEGISFEIADDYARLQMLLTHLTKTAWMVDRFYAEPGSFSRKDLNLHVAICKLTAPLLGAEIAQHVMMHFGALGYSKEVPIEMLMRGILSYVVGAEGGANIMRIIIGREFIGDVAVPYRG